MKRALIVIEPRMELSGIVLNKINRLRDFLEINLWAPPLIKRISKSHQASIISPEGPVAKDLAGRWKIPVVQWEIHRESINHAYEQSIKLSKEWHLYGKLPELLQIRQANIGEAVE